MDSSGLLRILVLLSHHMIFDATHAPDPLYVSWGNVSVKQVILDIVERQHVLPSWYPTSDDAEQKHGAVSSQSDDRWSQQMAFMKTVYSFQIREDTKPGTVVGKIEMQTESLTPIIYSVLEDDGENLFLLSPVSGEFLLSRSLDFETQRLYVLTVEVHRGGSQVSSVRVYLNVLDVNDNPPVFSQHSFSASLLENTRLGTCFLSLNVSDKDDGKNGELTLRLVSGDEEAFFFIHSSHHLCLNKELDREKKAFYNLTVTASDCAQPESIQLSATTYVTITVEDINDNAPFFTSARSVTVPEDIPLSSVIMHVHAEDKDAGANKEVFYYLNNFTNGRFSINNINGEIYLEKPLDRELIDIISITVAATDNGAPQMMTTMNFTVIVEDVNDNNPEFLQSSYNLSVTEDISMGTSLFLVQAFDDDIGLNGELRYSLNPVGLFVVDTVRGVVSVMAQLDRERDPNYSLIITAEDQGNVKRSATATISITVLDINDSPPKFSPDFIFFHVKENEDETSKLTHQVFASDADLGINSQLNYHIQTGNTQGLFSITPDGTFRILHTLDKEKESLYMVTITAVDSGVPPLTGTLTLHVIVEDVNDNYPEFTEEIYNTIVSEDSPVGTVFAIITASDADEGTNGEIRYFMEDSDVPFAIEEISGELSTTEFLDRETVAFYNLTVIGRDSHPTGALSSSVLVIILIGDVNDNWPQFINGPYVAYVPHEIPPGSVVCAVRAADEDTDMNGELHYSLQGRSSDMFSIDPLSGIVYTSRLLFNIDDVTLIVHVEDAGENPKHDISTISIRFQNVSDVPEISVDLFSQVLSEDEPVGTVVAVVSAASIRAAPVSFYLAAGNFEDTFQVDQSQGTLTIENPLDYENKKEFSLLIEARDSGSPPYSSFSETHLIITDVNDNSPHFTQAEYRCEIYENSPPSGVCDVFAIDADSSNYSAVWYDIANGNDDNFFTLDPESGLISTTLSLDRETTPVFNLTVEASEPDNPLHKDTTTVIIIVLDRNDNAPRFSQVFLAEVPENAPVGYIVTQVTSADLDLNPVVTYYILDQYEETFSIDFTTGFITVAGPLDREEQDHYVLRVNANDSEWSVNTDITILIADVNDNTPVFYNDFYSAFLPETKEKEVFVLQVYATDEDEGKNGEIFYVVEPTNKDFWVDAFSGEVYTKRPMLLGNSSFEMFDFIVYAFDCGDTQLFSNVSVTVRLEQFNYHPPVFLSISPLVVIPDHLPVGTEVVQLTAIDLDSISSSDIEYSLVSTSGNGSDFFFIQPNNGKIFLNQTLLESENLFFSLLVVASDQGFPPLMSQTEILFQVTGRNQFPPTFSNNVVTFSVPEDLPVGSVIGKVQADDRDLGPNGEIMFFISVETQNSPLFVAEISGLLTLIKELDFEAESMYYLRIKARDGGWIPKTAVLNVTVIVTDINDNPPVFSLTEYITHVPENSNVGTNILDVMATDADTGENAQIFYSIIAGHLTKFAIDSRNGTISTLDVFNYEQDQSFDLTIRAENMGGHTLFSLAHVVIHILDVNEFTPVFRKSEFNFFVFKNVLPGTIVGQVAATDYDQGPEGRVIYQMFGHSKNKGFDIDQLSGEVSTSSSLMKQGNSHIVLRVLARNHGVVTGMDVDESLIHITVMDTNDAPVFTAGRHEADVPEDSLIGTYVLTVIASDPDSVLEWNLVFYSIVSGNTNFSFSINQLSGVIFVNSELDRELWPVYNLTVTATDNGTPPATGSTNVIVTVGDINDNPPRLTSTKAQVMENQPEGLMVAQLHASDSDLPPNGGPFTFWLLNSSMNSPFLLTPDGVLFTTQVFDREQTSEYRVLVAVSDSGLPLALSSTTMFHVSVLDENDNPPLARNIVIEVKYFGRSFQGGMIGNVNPEDHDEADTFTCAIKSGPLNMFIIPNGTCELWSSSFQGEATFNITIEATDQLHFPVNNSIYINYKGFTNASLESCILFFVSSTSMQEFLSNKYLRFVKALDSLFNLQASKTHVFGMKRIGREILLLAAVKNYNGQFLSREVATGVSAGHKKLLETQSNVTISHITSDPCMTNPCQNGASCNKNIYISQEVAVLESPAVVFVSPQKEIFNCTCSLGFIGSLCEEDVDECEVNPCRNNGSCVNTAGSFHCHCLDGFSGSICSADVDVCLKVECQNGGTCIPAQDQHYCHCSPGFKGDLCEEMIDHCMSTPCVQGSCINLQTGFFCNCPFGVSGVHCDENSFGFEELSFMEFPPLDRRTNLISLEFATVQKNSLLVYNPGGSSSREYFALEIIDGMMRLSYELGSGPVRLQTHKQVADGHFHSVAASRIGNMGSLLVDNCTDIENDGFCFSKSDGTFSDRTLDVGNTNVTFGGLRNLEFALLHTDQIKTHDFVGCIRNIYVNGIMLKPSMALVTYNIFDKCPRAESTCDSVPCMNGGVCYDLWSGYLCECKKPFTGSDCSTEMSDEVVVRLDGNSYIEYNIKERFKRDHRLEDVVGDEIEGNNTDQMTISTNFKTKEDGVLLFILGSSGHITLLIKDKRLMYVFGDRLSGLLELSVGPSVADGFWHKITLFSIEQNTFLSIDDNLVFNSSEVSMDLTPVSLDKIILGAALEMETKSQQPGFSGCVQELSVQGDPLPVSGHSMMVEVRPSFTLLQSSCSSTAVCLSSLCYEERTVRKSCTFHCSSRMGCGSLQHNKSCICLQKTSEHFCDICTSTTDGCSAKQQGSKPLWLIAVVLPLLSIIVVVLMCACLHKTRQKQLKRQKETFLRKIGRGTTNTAFCFDDSTGLTQPTLMEKKKPPDAFRSAEQRLSVEFYGASELPIPPRELEYYEINSICSSLHSDGNSLHLSWTRQASSQTNVAAGSKQRKDIKSLFTRFTKESSRDDKTPTNTENVASPKPQSHAALPQHKKRFPQLEPLQPTRCLSFEEICKLDIPAESAGFSEASQKSGPAERCMMMEASSECETDSTCTCSESEYTLFPSIRPQLGRSQSNVRKENISSVSSFFTKSCFAVGQETADRPLSTMFEHWGNISNIHLPYSSYAPVFEDLARLHSQKNLSCDDLSDVEEII